MELDESVFDDECFSGNDDHIDALKECVRGQHAQMEAMAAEIAQLEAQLAAAAPDRETASSMWTCVPTVRTRPGELPHIRRVVDAPTAPRVIFDALPYDHSLFDAARYLLPPAVPNHELRVTSDLADIEARMGAWLQENAGLGSRIYGEGLREHSITGPIMDMRPGAVVPIPPPPPVDNPFLSQDHIDRLLEAVADIAFDAGYSGYYSGDSRADMQTFIAWAQEFEATRRAYTPGIDDGEYLYGPDEGREYMDAMYEFTTDRIAQSDYYGQMVPPRWATPPVQTRSDT